MQHSIAFVSWLAPVYLFPPRPALMLWFVLLLVLGFACWAMRYSIIMVFWRGAGLSISLFCLGVVVCPCACVGFCSLGNATLFGHGVLEKRRFKHPPFILHWCCALSLCLCWALPSGQCNLPWLWCLVWPPVWSSSCSALVLWFALVLRWFNCVVAVALCLVPVVAALRSRFGCCCCIGAGMSRRMQTNRPNKRTCLCAIVRYMCR